MLFRLQASIVPGSVTSARMRIALPPACSISMWARSSSALLLLRRAMRDPVCEGQRKRFPKPSSGARYKYAFSAKLVIWNSHFVLESGGKLDTITPPLA